MIGHARFEIKPLINVSFEVTFNFRSKLEVRTASLVDSLADVQVTVKCTLVQTLRLCIGRTVHRGSRGIALTFS